MKGEEGRKEGKKEGRKEGRNERKRRKKGRWWMDRRKEARKGGDPYNGRKIDSGRQGRGRDEDERRRK